MRKKTKGFTILELIITLSLTVVVLGVVYTFFFSNSKTLTTTEINSDLQLESETIQKELLLYGTEAKAIGEINGIRLLTEKMDKIEQSNIYSYGPTNSEGKLDNSGKLNVTNLKFRIESKEINFVYNSSESTLMLGKGTDPAKVLSTNVTQFKIRPLDYRMNPNGNFNNTTGLEISLILNKKKGYSDVTIPLSVIVKFRNK